MRIWATETEGLNQNIFTTYIDPCTKEPLVSLRHVAQEPIEIELLALGASCDEVAEIVHMILIPGCSDYHSAAECLRDYREAASEIDAREVA